MFPQRGNLFAILDSLKVADTVLFVISALSKPHVDEVSQDIMTSILAQGLPATTVAVMELENVPKKVCSNREGLPGHMIFIIFLISESCKLQARNPENSKPMAARRQDHDCG